MSWWNALQSERSASLEEDDIEDDFLRRKRHRSDDFKACGGWATERDNPLPCPDPLGSPKQGNSLLMLPPVALPTVSQVESIAPPMPNPLATEVPLASAQKPSARPSALSSVPLAASPVPRERRMICMQCRASNYFCVVIASCHGCKKQIAGAFECVKCHMVLCLTCLDRVITRAHAALVESKAALSTAESRTTVSPEVETEFDNNNTRCPACDCMLLATSLRSHWRSSKHLAKVRASTATLKYCSLSCTDSRSEWVSREAHERPASPFAYPRTGACHKCGGWIDRQ